MRRRRGTREGNFFFFIYILFRDRLMEDVQVTQLRAGLAGSDFSTPQELEIAARIALEGRDVRYITLPLADFGDTVEVSEEAVRAYYEARQDSYQTPESLNIEYLELRLDDYRQPITEDRLAEEFELVRDEFEVPTETRVSHILFEDDAEERLAQALAAIEGGMSFADAAAEYSDDVGSAGDGGDLGYTDGYAFPEPMEEAIASLGVGERSGAVETEAGTHLILVTDRREGMEVTLDSVRFELEERIQSAEARDALLLEVERLRDLAFNAADLSEPARALGLSVSTAEGVNRETSEGLFADRRLIDAAFSEDVLEAGHNSEVLELDSDLFAVLRVSERIPPAPLPLEDVYAGIEQELRTAAARDAAQAKAEEVLAALESGSSVEEAALEAGAEWQVELGAQRASNTLPSAVRERLFSLPAPNSEESVYALVEDDGRTGLGSSMYVLEFVRVSESGVDTLAARDREQLADRVAGETAGVLQQQLETALRDRAEVVVY